MIGVGTTLGGIVLGFFAGSSIGARHATYMDFGLSEGLGGLMGAIAGAVAGAIVGAVIA